MSTDPRKQIKQAVFPVFRLPENMCHNHPHTERQHMRYPVHTALAAALVLAAVPAAHAYQAGKTYRFTVLHTNDTHGRYWHNDKGEFGFAAQKTLIERIRKEVKAQGGQVLLLHAGDFNTGVPESDLQNARPDIEGLNMLGYEAAALGNHEFDIPQQILGMQEQWAKFPLLSANVRWGKTAAHLVKPYTVLNKGGLRIAVVGLTTPDTKTLGNPDYTKALVFDPAAEAAKRTLAQIERRYKPDVRIALTHLGYDEQGQHGTNAPGDVSLARALPENAFDLIIGGHSHTTVCTDGQGNLVKDYAPGQACKPDFQNGTWIVQAGEWGKYLGRADFEFKNGQTRLVNYQLIPINLKKAVKNAEGKTEHTLYQAEIPADPKVLAHLKTYQDQGDKLLGVEAGSTEGVFDGKRENVRSKQMPLGKLIATAQMERGRADVALMNGGGIRDSLPEGKITYRDILKVQPFGNVLSTVPMTGAELKAYLETALKFSPGAGAYPQFAGLEIQTYPQGCHIQGISAVKVKGEALDERKTYVLSIPSFIAAGGDNYPVLRGKPGFVDGGFVDAEVLKDYFGKNSPVKAADFATEQTLTEGVCPAK